MSGPEQAATVTPGQAAAPGDWTVDAVTNRSNSSPEFRKLCADVERLIRGDAHQLINGSAGMTAGLIMAQLAHVHHLAPADAKPGSERVAELVTEVNELRALLGEILADCPGCGYWHGPPTGRDQVARWRERAGLTNMPAVVTAGTGHLAEKIRGLAIPDEEN